MEGTPCCCSSTSCSVLPGTPVREPEFSYGYALVRGPSISETLRECPCSCCQFFLGGSSVTMKDRYSSIIPPDEREAILRVCQEKDRTFYVHCPLNINFANPSARAALPILRNHLTQLRVLPCACVLHVGTKGKKGDRGTLETVSSRLNQLDREGFLSCSSFRRVPYPLLLEVAAGQAGELGKNVEELRWLYEGLDRSKIGFCLDTQHVFASGMLSFENPEGIVNLYEELLSITPHGVSLVHLNDSLTAYNSRSDRHAALGTGQIWGSSTDSLTRLLELCTSEGIDLVTETDDAPSDIALLSTFQ